MTRAATRLEGSAVPATTAAGGPAVRAARGGGGAPVRRGGAGGRRGGGAGGARARLAHVGAGVVGGRRGDGGGRDRDALLVEPVGEGRHRAGGRPADVGVMGARGGEAEELAGDEDRGDEGDVG